MNLATRAFSSQNYNCLLFALSIAMDALETCKGCVRCSPCKEMCQQAIDAIISLADETSTRGGSPAERPAPGSGPGFDMN